MYLTNVCFVFSSPNLADGEVSTQSQEPVESEEFDY